MSEDKPRKSLADVQDDRQRIRRRAKEWTIIVLLGAIGSGMWALVLQPIWYSTSYRVIALISKFSTKYVDLLHRDIGEGLHEEHSLSLSMALNLFFMWLMIFAIVQAFKLLLKTKEADKDLDRITDKIENAETPQDAKVEKEDLKRQVIDLKRENHNVKGWVKVIIGATLTFAIILLPLFVALSVKDNYNNRAIVYIERSLEILAPELSSEEYLALRAVYRSVDKAQKFYQLASRLRVLAVERGVQLPSFREYR